MYKMTVFVSLLLFPQFLLAMDYSHPGAPRNTTDCVQYATYVADGVEEFLSMEAPRDKSRKELFEAMDKKAENDGREPPNGIIKMMIYDSYTWYKSTKYAYDPETMFFEIRMECEMAVIDQDYEEGMKDLQKLME